MSGRTEYNESDKNELAQLLLTYPEYKRSAPTTHRDVAHKLGRHTEQSWMNHYKKNKEDIDRRIERYKRKRDREWNENKTKSKQKGKGKEKEVKKNWMELDDEDEEEEDSAPPAVASTSKATPTTNKGKSRKRQATQPPPRPTASTSATALQQQIKKKKVEEEYPWDDEGDWEYLIKTLAEGMRNEWESGRVYKVLAQKYPKHNEFSWRRYYETNREEVDGAVRQYLSLPPKPKPKEEKEEPSKSDHDSFDDGGEEEESRAAGTKTAYTEDDWDNFVRMLAAGKKSGWSNKDIYQRMVDKYQNHTVSSWQTYHSSNRYELETAVEAYLKRDRTQKQQKKKQSKSNGNDAAASTSKSTQPQTQKKKQSDPAQPAPSASSSRPKLKPTQQTTDDKRKQKEEEPTVSNAKGKKRAAEVVEIESSSSDDLETSIIQPQISKPTQRPTTKTTTKQARKSASTAPFASTSTSTSHSEPKPILNPSTAPNPTRSRPHSSIANVTDPPEPRPLPTPLVSSRPPPRPIRLPLPTPSPPRLYPSEPSSSTPRTIALQTATLVQAAAVPLPEDQEDDYDEPSTQEDEEEEKGEAEDEGIGEDIKCVVEELARGEWLEEKKSKAWKDLALLWPKRSAQEWETFYSSTDQIQGKIMEMIGERFEEIQAGHEKERDVEKGWTEEDDRLIVEELGRIERFREENVVAWKSLARFYPRWKEEEWYQRYRSKLAYFKKAVAQTFNTRSRSSVSVVKEYDSREQSKESGRERKRGGKGKGKGREIEPALIAKEEQREIRMEDVVSQAQEERSMKPPATLPTQISASNRISSTASRSPRASSVAAPPPKSNASNRLSSLNSVTQKRQPSPRPASAAPQPSPAPSKPSASTSRPISARLEPPTPSPPRKSPPHEEPSPEPNRVTQQQNLDPPSEDPRSTTPSYTPPVASLQSDSSLPHLSQYSVNPSPLKAEREPSTSEDEEEDVEMSKEEKEDDEVAGSLLRPPQRIGTASSSAQTTTSSDEMIMEKLEGVTQEKDEMEDEEAGQDEEKEKQLKSNQQLPDLPDEEEFVGSFDSSEPFEGFDPDEPLFEALTAGEMKIITSHDEILESWERSGLGNGVKQEIEEEEEEGSKDLDRDADEWVGRDREGEGEPIEEEQQEEEDQQSQSEVSRSVVPKNKGKKRARSEASEAQEEVEDRAPRMKKARIGSSGRSSTSTTSQDVKDWRSNISQGDGNGEEEEQDRAVSPANDKSDLTTPNLPTPTLRQSTNSSPGRIPRAARAASNRLPLPPVPQKLVVPRQSTTSTTSTAPSTRPGSLRFQLRPIADELQIPLSVIEGLFFCLTSPSNLDTVKKLASYYSKEVQKPKRREKLREALKKLEWTFEEDCIALTGTRTQKEELDKVKGEGKCEERKGFLERSNFGTVDELPKYHYVRSY